ncbi:hypothetical protein COHA_002203 [Chlorella ohadii]|uniref:Uncharacterized protein n=1 Tax=Chlorella ohadii TaxID=2649997 RepID=A0AAD5DX61_9CHLO|nr:hypothetical protein COHA_002203 [Chlorella ohadii]
MKQLLSPAAQQQLAADQGFPGGSFEAGLRLYKAAVRTGDPDSIEELLTSFHANKAQRRLQLQLQEAANQGQSSLHEDDGLADIGSINGFACPASAMNTIFADLEQTHPPFYARLAHLRHVSSQQSMLVRATAPPVAVGGLYSHVSVAKQVGGRLAAALEEKAARKAAKSEGTTKQAPKRLARAAASRAVAVGVATVAVGAAAAAGANRPF